MPQTSKPNFKYTIYKDWLLVISKLCGIKYFDRQEKIKYRKNIFVRSVTIAPQQEG